LWQGLAATAAALPLAGPLAGPAFQSSVAFAMFGYVRTLCAFCVDAGIMYGIRVFFKYQKSEAALFVTEFVRSSPTISRQPFSGIYDSKPELTIECTRSAFQRQCPGLRFPRLFPGNVERVWLMSTTRARVLNASHSELPAKNHDCADP